MHLCVSLSFSLCQCICVCFCCLALKLFTHITRRRFIIRNDVAPTLIVVFPECVSQCITFRTTKCILLALFSGVFHTIRRFSVRSFFRVICIYYSSWKI